MINILLFELQIVSSLEPLFYLPNFVLKSGLYFQHVAEDLPTASIRLLLNICQKLWRNTTLSIKY